VDTSKVDWKGIHRKELELLKVKKLLEMRVGR